MNDEDFEQFITLLDAAIASDDPKIQKALKKFVFLIRLNLSDEDCKPGPFTKMMETIDDLQRRVGQVESTQQPYYGGQKIGGGYVGGGTAVDPFTHWYNNGTTTNITNAVSTTTIPVTTTSSTTGNITLSGSNCTGFTANAYSGMGNTTTYATFGEVDAGTQIKEQIKEKLAKLVKAA